MPKNAAWPKRHEAGRADEQLERQREDREDHHLGREVDVEACRRTSGNAASSSADDDQRSPTRCEWRAMSLIPAGTGLRAATAGSPPSAGRRATPAACGKNTLPKVSTKPISSDATSAPRDRADAADHDDDEADDQHLRCPCPDRPTTPAPRSCRRAPRARRRRRTRCGRAG